MKRILFLVQAIALPLAMIARQPVPVKPRILISTDIGGTDPDDNQSIAHFLMYCHLFTTEGLVSSPSFGEGSKQQLLDMIDLYEKDLPKLQQHVKNYVLPDDLRKLCKQGRKGAAPLKGYAAATEGSDWIVSCARKKSTQPLWVLVWGGLEDVAQALHDAPDIQHNIRIYWIGGPNKKWSANAYAYVVKHFPGLWFIENNASYYGLFSDTDAADTLKKNKYYDAYIRGAGYLGKDFKKYYGGTVKMGDTPSLLYMMDGDPANPLKESWGGSFVQFKRSPRRVFYDGTSIADTVAAYTVVELHFKGPVVALPEDSACFTMAVQAKIGEQKWPGYYAGNGDYVVRYAPKQAETVTYQVSAAIPGFAVQKGQFVVRSGWPGKPGPDDYVLGDNWYTDRPDSDLFYGIQQGARTVSKWREAVLLNWAKRWAWLQ
ncbi:hypothetical protein HNQ91_000440 [Filimonas zeae]|nr:nucleoside hydrolase-like domain-containing protein [Filimonas zeae]MDR6337418.1 hypothetical protein [Filimonas zeae]